MARGKSILPFALLGSFLAILLLIAAVRMLFPGVLRDGFRDVSCIGVSCAEGEFCQNNACKKINPPYTNNYFSEGFEGEELPPCPEGYMRSEAGMCIKADDEVEEVQ